MEQPQLLTTNEVARDLEVSRRTVHRMVEAGELQPFTKMPGQTGAYIFTPAAVAALKAARSAGAVMSGELPTA